MAAFDQYLKSVPKIPFVNVSDRTIPAYGAMTLWTLDKHGWFQALPGASTHKVGEAGGNNKHGADILFSSTHHVAGGTVGPVVDAPHAERSDDDPQRIPNGETLSFSDMAVEWATAFNLGNAVEPKKRGYCYQQLPAIGILHEPEVPIKWGNALTIRVNSFTLVPCRSQENPSQYGDFEGDFANGWPFMGRVPNTDNLVIIGGLNNFIQADEAVYI